MLFCLYQINGKCRDNLSLLEMSHHDCLHKGHQQQLMSYEDLEGSSHFVGGHLRKNSA